MCQASTVAPDWVTKGCHIHVNGVELAVHPDHKGGVVFKRVFSSSKTKAISAAMKAAIRRCLTNAAVRKQWVKHIDDAMLAMVSETGGLRELALGRLAEMHFLRIALLRYKD